MKRGDTNDANLATAHKHTCVRYSVMQIMCIDTYTLYVHITYLYHYVPYKDID